MPTIRRCCIAGCMSNSRQNPQLQFFQFPRPDNPFYKLWTQACHASLSRILPFKKPVVCAMHFHPHCIGGRRLTGSAVPTLKLEVPTNLKAVEQQAMVEEIEKSRKCAYINAVVYEWLVRANLDPQLRGSITHGMIKEKAETAKQIIGCDSFMADNRWLNRFRESHLSGFAQKLASNQLKPMGPSLWIPDIVHDLQHLFPPTSAERIESFDNMPEQYMNYIKQYSDYDEEEEIKNEQSGHGGGGEQSEQNFQQQPLEQQREQQQHHGHLHQQDYHHQTRNYYNQHHSGYDAYIQQQQQHAGYNAYQDYYSQQQQQPHHLHQHPHQEQNSSVHYSHHGGYGYNQQQSLSGVQSSNRPISRSPTQTISSQHHHSHHHTTNGASGRISSPSSTHVLPQRDNTSYSGFCNITNTNSSIKRAKSNEPDTEFQPERKDDFETDLNKQSNRDEMTESPTVNTIEPMTIDDTENNRGNNKCNGSSSSGDGNQNNEPYDCNSDERNRFKIKLPLSQTTNCKAESPKSSVTLTRPSSSSPQQLTLHAKNCNGTINGNVSSASTSPKSMNGGSGIQTNTNGHTSVSPTPSTVVTQIKEIETYTQALEYLKPLEDFALFKENFRAIGLISQLEMILKKGERSTMPSLTDN